MRYTIKESLPNHLEKDGQEGLSQSKTVKISFKHNDFDGHRQKDKISSSGGGHPQTKPTVPWETPISEEKTCSSYAQTEQYLLSIMTITNAYRQVG